MSLIKAGRSAELLEMLSTVKSHEQKATLTAFIMVFILMVAYFVLRPVRDAMASDWSDTEVSFLWNLQFFVSIGIVSLYGALISHIRFKMVVPLVYSIFAASFVGFYFITPIVVNPTLVEKSFYVWVSAFSLFHLSVFWSLMADTFSKEQGKRLFAIIAAGGSVTLCCNYRHSPWCCGRKIVREIFPGREIWGGFNICNSIDYSEGASAFIFGSSQDA